MKKELTNEVLEEMVNCNGECIGCPAQSVCDAVGIKQTLVTALLEERAKPKVWDSIHTTVDKARIIYYAGDKCLYDKEYTRKLPKTRTRIIAEEIEKALSASPRYKTEVEIIESALNKYAEELEGKE